MQNGYSKEQIHHHQRSTGGSDPARRHFARLAGCRPFPRSGRRDQGTRKLAFTHQRGAGPVRITLQPFAGAGGDRAGGQLDARTG
ncbi:MAG: hypothetical protein MZV64_23530 [Ignavibacteriales bacterium]|nr:hypothetical protein [Ignavibacteriales bacterium]